MDFQFFSGHPISNEKGSTFKIGKIVEEMIEYNSDSNNMFLKM